MDEFAWAAGLFEGEGSITSHGDSRVTIRRLKLTLTSTDEDVVRRFHRIVGVGTVCGPFGPYGRGKKPHWEWDCQTQPDVWRLADRLLPYLSGRRIEQLERACIRVEACGESSIRGEQRRVWQIEQGVTEYLRDG